MSGLALSERVRIVAITATLTSAAWIVLGGGLIDGLGGNLAVLRKVEPASAQRAGPARAPAPTAGATGHAQPVPWPAPVAGGYRIPVAGVGPGQLTDTFTQARAGGNRVHDAIDIMAPRGTPVLAAAGGTVEKLFTSKQGGLTIYVRSPDRRTITYYAHLDSYAPGLAERARVLPGQPIGTVGSTGNADPTAPHLHFAVFQTTPEAGWWQSGRAINPYPLLTARPR